MRPSLFRPPVLVIALAGLLPVLAVGQASKPTITAIENVASYGNGPVSPGEMIVIFGSGMGPSQVVSFQADQNGRVPEMLSGVQVLFDGTAAPLIYVLATQISAMVPYSVTGKSSSNVQVAYQGTSSGPFPKQIVASAPGIFTADASGTAQAAMTNSDGALNTTATPATPGSYVTFYLTGEGQTTPPGSDGNIATGTANVNLPVTVLIAGRTAQLLYAGSAPGNVNGFCQINAVVPPDLQYGGNLPLVVQIGGVSSQTGVTLAVSGPPAPLPGAPQSLSASLNSNGQVVLTWTPADSLATRFHVERQIAGTGFTEIAVIQATATTFADPSVTGGATYQYRVRAEDDYGFSPYSAVVTTTVPAAQLLPPTNLQASAVSQTQINLTWSAANTNASRFHIERKAGTAGTYAEITVVPSTVTSYQDTTVQANTGYTYRARSEGATGLSGYSNESSATTPSLPLPPAPTMQGNATAASQIHLSWTSTASRVVRFRVERRTATGTYAEIAQPSATATTYDDSGLIASTAYLYRMRVETAAGLSAYSNEITVTTLQALPAAPTNLQATPTSTTQITLTWTNNAPDATAIRVEFEAAGATSFTDIGAGATLTSTTVSNLQPNSMYSFRVRAQNVAGYSAFSNISTATTLQALPAAPTNLKATAVSSNQLALTWTNNAPNATAIRVESAVGGSSTFTDIGAAATLTSTGITNLQPNTVYSFRVRAQSVAGYSAYSNLITATAPITVFLVHGIGQGARNMQSLQSTLLAPGGIDQSRFVVDAKYDYGSCAANTFCPSSCTISNGGNLLATQILSDTVPGSNIIIVGYSLGGLIARDMLAYNYQGVTQTRHIKGLITLGTPNLGYPYASLDALGVLGAALTGSEICPVLMQQMASDFRTQEASRTVNLSPLAPNVVYLPILVNQWSSLNFSSNVGSWLAISGGYCKKPIRTGDLTNSVGCPDYNTVSDGVVCDQSARNLLNAPNGPTNTAYFDAYAHTNVAILCGFTDSAPQLDMPVAGDPLSQQLWSAINAIR